MSICVFLSFFFFFSLFSGAAWSVEPSQKVSAFLRVKNEIKTIEACLDSIDGVFDKIVIIHSNEPDDGSAALMNRWCGARSHCEIHEYPYAVISSHDPRYLTDYKPENSLAAYYNFGLQFFEPEEWVVKIDGDQVYLKQQLAEVLAPFKEGKADDRYRYGLKGYNTYIRGHDLVIYKPTPFNGNDNGDSFIIKRKDISGFKQGKFYEYIDTSRPPSNIFGPVWFHFMKRFASGGVVRKTEDAAPDEIGYLTKEQKDLFEQHIRPLLKNSPYYSVDVPENKN